MSYILKQPLKGVLLNMCSLKLVKLDVPNKYNEDENTLQ